MFVVVIAMRRVSVFTVEVVDVIAMRDGLVSTTLTVSVVVNLGLHVSIRGVLVVVVPVQVVRMTVVQVVDVAIMLHGNVAAGRPVAVVVIGVGRVGGHWMEVLSSLSDDQ